MSALIRPRDVCNKLGVSRATLYRMLRNDVTFPRPIKLSPQCVAWRVAELDTWLDIKDLLGSPTTRA